MDVLDRVILITGASSGVGAALATKLAEVGARVVVTYSRSAEAAEAVVAQITATNDFGTSELSEKNTVGAEIQTEPHKPSTPPSRGTQTS